MTQIFMIKYDVELVMIWTYGFYELLVIFYFLNADDADFYD